MSKRTLDDKFSIEMDGYFKGIENKNKSESEEYDELLELGKALADKDFSKDSNKEAVFNRFYQNMNKYRGDNIMKKSNRFKRPKVAIASFAATCMLGISLMQTTFAQEIVEKIINKITLGNITAVQYKEPEIETYPIPKELKGKLFDKDGNPLEVVTKDYTGGFYTEEGEKIADCSSGEIITIAQQQKEKQETTLVIREVDKLNDYTCFNVTIPTYLPDGYEFDRAEFYKDENGEVKDVKYINLYFINKDTGKNFFSQQRFACEETRYTMSGYDKIEKIEINGVKAILSDDRFLDWEADGVIFGLSSRGAFSKDELIKVAESIK